jgi:hypothetical protein
MNSTNSKEKERTMKLTTEMQLKSPEKDCELGMFYDIQPGMNLGYILKEMFGLAKKYDCKVFAVFNEWLPLVLSPNDELDSVCKKCDDAMRERDERRNQFGDSFLNG